MAKELARRKLSNRFHICVVENDERVIEILIVKTSNGDCIPEDEPLFLTRGRDHLAVKQLTNVLQDAIDDDCVYFYLAELAHTIKEFCVFAENNPLRMKQPGITKGK